jgi:hypothetical protein
VGAVIPLKVNPLPLIPTEETVMLELPVFVTVSDRVCLLPTLTLPKLKLVGFDPSAPGEIPVPDNARVSVGFAASEVMVTPPLTLPVVCGAKVIVNVVLWEVLSVTGAVIPLS